MIRASDWIAFNADRTPDKVALIDQGTGRRFTYAELNERSARLAGYMRDEWNIQAGDVAAILAKNSAEYYVFQFACIKLGAIMLPLNWRLVHAELVFILNDADAKGILYDSEFADRTPPLLEACAISHSLELGLDRDSGYEAIVNAERGYPSVVMNPLTTHATTMTIMYTSGTTGHPKGVLITHGMLFWNMVNMSQCIGLNNEAVHYVVLPTFHTAGLNLYANPVFHHGGTVVVAREFDPALTLRTFADESLGITHFFGVPAIYLFLSQHDDFATTDLSRVKSWGCGGAPMPAALLKKYANRGLIVQLGFGMTETSPTVFLIAKRRATVKPTSVGKPLMHTRVRVVDENMQDVPLGDIGEVIISGPNVTPGYHNRPDANDSNFTTDEHGTRWLHSGDAGMMDDEGCIYIVDRYKDMYISGGENVYPAEVEQVIFQLDGIKDVAVIGVPDEQWGESGMAIVVRGDNALQDAQIIDHCRRNLAKFKVPKSVAYVDELPRNAAGKVLKRELRKQFVPESGK
jgi:fatty-acyl-CoA synthase